jgi:hypothetical protein
MFTVTKLNPYTKLIKTDPYPFIANPYCAPIFITFHPLSISPMISSMRVSDQNDTLANSDPTTTKLCSFVKDFPRIVSFPPVDVTSML